MITKKFLFLLSTASLVIMSGCGSAPIGNTYDSPNRVEEHIYDGPKLAEDKLTKIVFQRSGDYASKIDIIPYKVNGIKTTSSILYLKPGEQNFMLNFYIPGGKTSTDLKLITGDNRGYVIRAQHTPNPNDKNNPLGSISYWVEDEESGIKVYGKWGYY